MAKVIVNSVELPRLKEINKFEKTLTSDYLTDTGNSQTAFMLSQFFQGNKEKLELLNMSYSIPYMMSTIVCDYVGDPKVEGMPKFTMEEQAMSFVWGGYGVFKARVIDGEYVIEYASPDGYVKYSDGREQLLTYLTSVDEESNVVTEYILDQNYTVGKIESRLYKLTKTPLNANTIEGVEVPLSTLDDTKDIQETESTNLKMNPIVVVHNKKIRDKVKYGTSELEFVKSLITSLEVQVVNIQDQFLKHLRAKLAFPAGLINLINDETGEVEKGHIDSKALEAFPLEQGDQIPQYVTNSNPLIEKAFEEIEDLLVQIAVISKLPPEFFGVSVEGGNAEATDTKQIRMSNFIKKIMKARAKFHQGIEQIVQIGKDLGKIKDDEGVIIWGGIFPVNKANEVTELTTAVDGRLMSQKRAIMQYQEIDEDEAQVEIDQINSENVEVTVDEFGT